MRFVPALLLVVATPALAQREFVEEIKPGPAPVVAKPAVDLDAPDVPTRAAAPTKPPSSSSSPSSPSSPSQAPAAAADAASPPIASDEEAARVGWRVQPIDPAALAKSFDAHVAQGRPIAAVQQALLDVGVHGVVGSFQARALGIALAREADRVAASGDADASVEVADAALRAAPDVVAVRLTVAHAHAVRGDWGAALRGSIDAVRTLPRDPVALSSTVVRVAAAALAVLLGLWLALVVLVGGQALRLAAFDLWASLPRGAHIAQATSLVVLVALAPLCAGAGPLLGALWLATLALPYVSRRARTTFFVLGALTALVPVVAPSVAALQVWPSSRAARAHAALFELDAQQARAALRSAEAAGGKLTMLEQAALALQARRDGNVDEAVARWRALGNAYGQEPFVHGGYGVAAALAGQADLAVAELTRARELAVEQGTSTQTIGAAGYDAYVLHHRAGHVAKADEAVAAVDPALLDEFRRATFRSPDEIVNQNRALVDPMPDTLRALREFFDDEAVAGPAADALAGRLFAGLRGPSSILVFALFPIAWAVLLVVRGRLSLAVRCESCGAPASRRVDGKDVPAETCAACFHVLRNKKARVDAKVKQEREAFIARRRRIRRVTTTVLAVLQPGLGHLFGGAVVRGTFLLAVALGSVVVMALALDVVPGWNVASTWPTAARVAVPAMLWLFVWGLSLRGASGVADEQGKGLR